MFAQHKKKIIAGIAAAFLAALGLFYEGVIQVVTDTLIAPIEAFADPAVETEAETE